MTAKRNLLIGIQTFEELREKNYIYIDKTSIFSQPSAQVRQVAFFVYSQKLF